jgi:hypothetical protein
MAYLVMDASPRPKGNCAVLSSLAAKDIAGGGEAVRLLALRDLEVAQCVGCMSCVFTGARCRLDDDIYEILDAVAEATGLMIVAPTYVTTIPAILKLVLDRYLLVPPYYARCVGKHAVTVAVASPIDWLDFQVPLLNTVALGLGYTLLDTVIMYGAGPGEVLLDDAQVSRFRAGVARLMRGERREYTDTISHRCPVCFNHLLERVQGTRFRCAVCHVPAELASDGFVFKAADLRVHRWTPGPMKDHFDNWIRKTEGTFRSRLREITKKRRELLGPRRRSGEG